MFSLAELQNSKASLKKRVAEPAPACAEPDIATSTTTSGRAQGSSAIQPDRNEIKTNIPLPTISLQTLVSTRVGLHKVPSVRSPTFKSTPPAFSRADDPDGGALPAFAKRKELFEKQKNRTSNALPTTATVRVGDEIDEKVFTVDIKTLRTSPRFRDELRDTAGLEELSLPDYPPSVFQIFLDFCQNPCEPIKYQPGQYSTEPWISSSAAAWVLGFELRARRFEKYALSQFIQNCAIMVKGPWEYIEERAVQGSSLSRFSNHWIAWNTSFSNRWTHEYIGLEAAELSSTITPETRDPRLFDIDHWYKDCGDDFNALCEHDPVHRKREQQRQARKSKPPPAEWGAEQECQSQNRF